MQLISKGVLRLDTSTNNNILLLPRTGNVGIGTTNPNYVKLLVYSDANQTDETATFALGKNVTNGYMMYQGVNQASAYGYIGVVKTGVNYNTALVLQQNNGNVGIGTTAPGAPHVVQDSTYTSDIGRAFKVGNKTTPAQVIGLGYDSTADFGFISLLKRV